MSFSYTSERQLHREATGFSSILPKDPASEEMLLQARREFPEISVAEPEGPAAAAAQAYRAERSRGAFTQGGHRRARPSRDSSQTRIDLRPFTSDPGSSGTPDPHPEPGRPAHLHRLQRPLASDLASDLS